MPKQVETKKPEEKSTELTAEEERLLAKLEEEYSYHSKKMNDVCNALKLNRDRVLKMSKEINAKLNDPKLEIKTFNYFGSWYIGLQRIGMLRTLKGYNRSCYC